MMDGTPFWRRRIVLLSFAIAIAWFVYSGTRDAARRGPDPDKSAKLYAFCHSLVESDPNALDRYNFKSCEQLVSTDIERLNSLKRQSCASSIDKTGCD
jgi:hypothetical protein